MNPYFVVIRKSDAQIGLLLKNTFLGSLFFFDEFKEDEVLNSSFCLFLDDHEISLKDFKILEVFK